IRLNIAGAKHIELVVDFGENGGLQDRFDWVEPALIR
ncbi:MAG: NPCBM/NEW2 domain-containing protein, partial [Planctomycetes bacterium]|nr:NPCBM/NEW2 domain-containing protein [Planctomycetota bacterium]